MRGSRVFRSKRTIKKNFTRKFSKVGTKTIARKHIGKARKGTSSHFNFKKLESSIDFKKLRRQNTQGPQNKNDEKLIEEPSKKYNIPRVSVSNYSIMSIQKEKIQMSAKMNNLIAKSPTLSRHKRKSSFMMRLPETLKKVMNLNVTMDMQRRSSFQSGFASINNQSEDGLSAIESEENSESLNHSSQISKSTTVQKVEAKPDKKKRAKFYKEIFQTLKKEHFNEISKK